MGDIVKIVRGLSYDRHKKRFKKRTFIGFTLMNTILGKLPALYLEGYVLVLFNHMCQNNADILLSTKSTIYALF